MQETSLLELLELNLDYFFETVRLHGYGYNFHLTEWNTSLWHFLPFLFRELKPWNLFLASKKLCSSPTQTLNSTKQFTPTKQKYEFIGPLTQGVPPLVPYVCPCLRTAVGLVAGGPLMCLAVKESWQRDAGNAPAPAHQSLPSGTFLSGRRWSVRESHWLEFSKLKLKRVYYSTYAHVHFFKKGQVEDFTVLDTILG